MQIKKDQKWTSKQSYAISGHYFIDEFKLEAYARLTEYFGFTPYEGPVPRYEPVNLSNVLQEAWRLADWTGKPNFLRPEIPNNFHILGNKSQLIGAFKGLINSIRLRTLYLEKT